MTLTEQSTETITIGMPRLIDDIEQFGPAEDNLAILHDALDGAYTHMVALCVGWYDWRPSDVVDEACQKFERKHAPAHYNPEAHGGHAL